MNAEPPHRLLALQRSLTTGLIFTVIAVAVTGALVLLSEPAEESAFRIIGSLTLAGGALAMNVAYVVVLRRERSEVVRSFVLAGIVISLLATATLMLSLLFTGDLDFSRSDGAMIRIGLAGLATAFGLAYTGALLQARDKPKLIRGMAISTGVAAWTVAGSVILVTLGLELIEATGGFGFAIALLIVFTLSGLFTIVGTIAVPIAIVSKAASTSPEAESIDPRVRVELSCPKCGERQFMRPGFATCAACRAGLFIELEEPRCACGYLLYQLTGETCPECGRTISSAQEMSETT